MARQAVVVGGGAIGISCAYFLQRSGFDITVVERDRVGRGCSYANWTKRHCARLGVAGVAGPLQAAETTHRMTATVRTLTSVV